MSLPMQVQSRLYHFKSHILDLVAAHVFSVAMVSRLFGISRTTGSASLEESGQRDQGGPQRRLSQPRWWL